MAKAIDLLTSGLQQGNESAFREIFDMYHRRIYGFCITHGQGEDDAQEVVQEVFIKLWTNREKINPDLNLESYIFTIAKNLIIDKFKELSRRKAADHYQMYLLDPQNDTEQQVLFNELQETMQKTFDALPEMRKLVFQMSRYKGYSNQEIADELGISIRTVENHIHKALDSFKTEIGQSSAIIIGLLSIVAY